MTKPRLILLFGLPRSGTTWIGKLFDSHLDTVYLHEPDSVSRSTTIPLLTNRENLEDSSKLKEKVAFWLKLKNEKVIASRPFFRKNYMSVIQWYVYLSSSYLSKLLLKFNISIRPIKDFNSASVIVWKSIESLGRLATIRANEKCISIHILRHPCGQIASTLKGEERNKFDCKLPSCEDFELFEQLFTESGHTKFSLARLKAMQPEERLAVRWGIMNDFALEQENDADHKVLIYEDLCRNPNEKLLEIMSFAGLNVSKECQSYLDESIQSNDKVYYGTQKIPLDAAYKWRKFLTQEQQDNIKNIINQFKSGQFYLNDF